ncbi:MAG: IS1182 family transposase [Candidatus Omnitrophica bacterium]|nr:IS1182 family transposase [Candidatus Omnitrophota bacterium]MCB9772143.1 IS1182 family transposase [Candidatus Omnitrophota bacterium]
MLKNPQRQASFYDAEYLCEELIPAESYYRKFKEIVSPLMDELDFETMYCQDNGRPPISPKLLAMVLLLQFHKNLSDREMERACMYDIEIKYALGLKLNERPFDHSSLGDFRKRLLDNGQSKMIFDKVLNRLIDLELIKRDEIQRIDATHMIADIAIPTVVALVKKGVREILKPLKGQKPKVYEKILGKIDMAEYTREKVNQADEGRLDIEKRKVKLVKVVMDARCVLEEIEGANVGRDLRKRIEMLKRILQENVKESQEKIEEREYKDKPKDLLVSPIDEDARYGCKSDTKRFVGYKANVTEAVENHFITNINVMRGNRPDGEPTVQMIVEQKKSGLVPQKLIGDTAYANGVHRKLLNDNATMMVAPLRNANQSTQKVYPKSLFHYDEKTLTLTCPQGVKTNTYFEDHQHGLKQFHFPMSVCRKCPVRKECTKAEEGRRTVGISMFNKELREAEIYNKTDEFKKDMKLRPPIEGKLSELTRYHGLRRAKYRGLPKVQLQALFTAAAVNIKRWIKLVLEGFAGQAEVVMGF